MNIFSTPSDPERFGRPFYDWVRVGVRTFEAAERAAYPTQEWADDVEHRALEVFPHATDVFVRGRLPPSGVSKRVSKKRAWRLETLRLAGVEQAGLCMNRSGEPTLDSIDAALAALTGLHALEDNYTSYGIAGEWIVAPGSRSDPFSRS